MKKCKSNEFPTLLADLSSDDLSERIKADRRRLPADLRRLLSYLQDSAAALAYLENVTQQCPEMLPLAERHVKLAFLESAHQVVLKNRRRNKARKTAENRRRARTVY